MYQYHHTISTPHRFIGQCGWDFALQYLAPHQAIVSRSFGCLVLILGDPSEQTVTYFKPWYYGPWATLHLNSEHLV